MFFSLKYRQFFLLTFLLKYIVMIFFLDLLNTLEYIQKELTQPQKSALFLIFVHIILYKENYFSFSQKSLKLLSWWLEQYFVKHKLCKYIWREMLNFFFNLGNNYPYHIVIYFTDWGFFWLNFEFLWRLSFKISDPKLYCKDTLTHI